MKHQVRLLTPLPRYIRFRLAVNRLIDYVGIWLCKGRAWPLSGTWWGFFEKTKVYWNA